MRVGTSRLTQIICRRRPGSSQQETCDEANRWLCGRSPRGERRLLALMFTYEVLWWPLVTRDRVWPRGWTDETRVSPSFSEPLADVYAKCQRPSWSNSFAADSISCASFSSAFETRTISWSASA